ncbi:hypothetical protein [Roseibium suaedae]|uniref:Uncharacterized protein n=1 Tax=Roseibium suaedae TaxID=735517 RepID=A0A1M7GTT3_9HYPH|nr:hypothetical protein [Roseibium suaedae]SHM19239.1 hypothetical protein SAMN05444272_2008 [Roseibium suaedae]
MGLSGWFGARSAPGAGDDGKTAADGTAPKASAAAAAQAAGLGSAPGTAPGSGLGAGQAGAQAGAGAGNAARTGDQKQAAATLPQKTAQTPGNTRAALAAKAPTPNVSALNQQVVQAVQFSNTETSNYADNIAITPPEIMVSQTAGMAVQDAKNYMNAIMQIAVAAQAVAIKKAAEGPQPASTIKEIPFMEDIQNMVTQAVTVFGTVSTTAGSSAKTVISDLKSS